MLRPREPRSRRPLPARPRARERLAANAGRRGRCHGRHEPPAATRAGLRALERGGNAVDAALAAAAVLTVAEPTDNGVGGDAFALVWEGGSLHGINGSGRSPAELGGRAATDDGPHSVTVPGAVRLWDDLASRFGRFGLDVAVGPAADLAEAGLACTARISHKWAQADAGTPSRAGTRRALSPARARCNAPPDRSRRSRGAVRGGDRGCHRTRLLALGGRSARPSLGVGRAAPAHVSRHRGVRAAAERTGRGRAPRARALRGARARGARGGRVDEARPGRHPCGRARRPAAGRLLRRAASRCASGARAARDSRRSFVSHFRAVVPRTSAPWTGTAWPYR